MSVLQQLLEAGVGRAKAINAIIRHISWTGDQSLLTPDLVKELKSPIPVEMGHPILPVDYDPMDDLSDDFAGRPHKWSQWKTLAEIILYKAYSAPDEGPVFSTQDNLLILVSRVWQANKVSLRLPTGHSFRLILSRLRTGGYYSGLPRIDTVGPTNEGLVIIQPRLAELDKVLGYTWSDWLAKAIERQRKNE